MSFCCVWELDWESLFDTTSISISLRGAVTLLQWSLPKEFSNWAGIYADLDEGAWGAGSQSLSEQEKTVANKHNYN